MGGGPIVPATSKVHCMRRSDANQIPTWTRFFHETSPASYQNDLGTAGGRTGPWWGLDEGHWAWSPELPRGGVWSRRRATLSGTLASLDTRARRGDQCPRRRPRWLELTNDTTAKDDGISGAGSGCHPPYWVPLASGCPQQVGSVHFAPGHIRSGKPAEAGHQAVVAGKFAASARLSGLSLCLRG